MTSFEITTPLLSHQQECFEKLHKTKVGALLMEMGTGKTLAALKLIQSRSEKIDKVIWLCPTSLKQNSVDQILKHTDVSLDRIYVFNSKTDDSNIPEADFYIIGIQSMGQSDREFLAFEKLLTPETFIVLDESAYIKNSYSKTARRLINRSRDSKYRLILNGTPISQGIEDLYSQFAFLHPRILGYWSFSAFARNHLVYSEKFKGMISSRVGRDVINRKITPYIYHIRKNQCVDLPEKTYSSRCVDLTTEQGVFYEEAKERFAEDVMSSEFEMNGVAVYKLFNDLRKISNGISPKGYSIENNKITELVKIVEQISESHIVIWANYQKSIEDIRDALGANFCHLYYGKLNESERNDSLKKWRELGGALVATPTCGGYGLTVTEASYCIYFSNSFKYSERIQSEDRIHRIGQKKNCHYVNIWADCGIEDRISLALKRKGNALEYLKEDLERIKKNKGRLTKMMSNL